MNTLFFRATPETYAALAPAIDAADLAQPEPFTSYIATGHCEHILPQQPTIGTDGLAYVAVPEFLLGVNGADQWTQFPGVEQITQEQYQAAMPGQDLTE